MSGEPIPSHGNWLGGPPITLDLHAAEMKNSTKNLGTDDPLERSPLVEKGFPHLPILDSGQPVSSHGTHLFESFFILSFCVHFSFLSFSRRLFLINISTSTTPPKLNMKPEKE